VWLSRFQQWLTKTGSALKGIAYMPEGTGSDPATFALFGDLAWSSSAINQTTWFQNYAASRYGGADTNATAAWDQLRQGPYSMSSGSWDEPQDGLFTARPSLTASTTASWSPSSMRYNAATVQTALADLLKVAPALQSTDAYKFDLVNTARQALANRSRVLLPLIDNAYTAKNLTTFRSLVSEWNTDEADLDKLLATDPRFLVGTWLAPVPAWGASTTEKTQLQYDARSILTTWGDTRAEAESNGLRDYAAREWSGMVSDLYAKRWASYFSALDTALATNTTPASVDFFAMDDAWARATTTYPTTTTGDPVTVATTISTGLPAIVQPPVGPITGIGGKCVDITGGNSADGTALQLYSCNGTAAQTWTVAGNGTLQADGKCMDVRNGAVTAGTVVQIYGCNGTPAQSWVYRSDKTLMNTKSSLCLAASGNASSDGTALIISTCSASTAGEIWNVPQSTTPRISGLTVASFDSQETVGENGAAANAVDGNPATIWHTQWSSNTAPMPHQITLNLNNTYSVSCVYYLPRQDSSPNGTIANYEVYLSSDGTTWGAAVKTGTWVNTKAEESACFTPAGAHYVRLRATSEVNGNPWTSAAEINVAGS
jgi:alpha-N-acetylglucosaminidase